MAKTSVPLHTVEIRQRPPKTWFQFVHGILFLTVYLTGCVMIHAMQLIFMLPLKLIPGELPKRLYEEGIRESKGSFGKLIVFVTDVFAPGTLRITFETEGSGKFSPEEIEQVVVRDRETRRVVGMNLPKKMVIVANHQMYADWWYLWTFLYYLDMHKDVLIMLKKSLKWLPLVGWGMQIFRFIFLARVWAEDRVLLSNELAKLGRKAEVEDNPLAFIIYPEGTLVSEETRPISKKYADKMGIDDMTHMLLPRSTGLLYSLRALSPKVPSLKLLDITVAYPGVPRLGYGQSYYTLRSIFMDRVPPPVIHMHLRLFDVSSSVPIGNLAAADPVKLPALTKTNGTHTPQLNGQAIPLETSPTKSSSNLNGNAVIEVDVPESEKETFDLWLRELWREKDEKIEEYFGAGEFKSAKSAVDIPIKPKRLTDIADAYCFFVPALVGYVGKRIFGN